MMLAYYYGNNRHYRKLPRTNYIIENINMIVLLVSGIYLGSVYQMEGLKNTAIVWSVLYGGSKSTECLRIISGNFWVYVFFLSVGVYFSAL